jgi:hypothetical protein
LGPRRRSDAAFLRRLPGAATMGFLPFLRAALSRRFYLPTGEAARLELARLYTEAFPHRLECVVEEAERLCRHRVEVLGCGEFDLGPEIDWHRDPLTGRSWPRRPWPAYDPVHEHEAGDPKRVCELNRHQHLPRLAKAYYLTGDERFAREAVAQLLGWIEQNPPGIGIHWHSSLELGLRALSWLWTLWFLLPSRALDETAARAIGKSLCAQLDHVHAFPSLYSAPNTHLLGEAAALFVGGLVFDGSERGTAWRRRGGELLAGELERQIDCDGAHVELSDCYHCYALDFLLQAFVLARRCGRPFGAVAGAKLERMLEFLAHLTRPDGALPRLGDDDGGRALALAEPCYRDGRDLLSTGAALFARADFKQRAGGYREETFWLLGEAGRERFRALPEEAPRGLRSYYSEAGYYVLRTGWGRDDAHLTFDCGGLGRLGGGHGHADALSLTLHAAGRDLLVDPGTFVYNGDPAWRDFFRSTRAHNTVAVDDRDQSDTAGTFRWRRGARASLVESASFEGLDYLAGEHDGYAGLGVIHRRRLVGARPDWWLVVDELRGEGEHTIELFFHFAPEAEVSELEQAGDRREARLTARSGRAGLALSIHATSAFRLVRLRGADSPPQGWVSRRYGEKAPATVVSARLRACLPATLVTVLAPFADGSDALADAPFRAHGLPLWQPDADRRPSLALALRRGAAEEVVVVSPERAEVQVGACRAAGELFCARFENGRPERLFALAAERFAHRGESWLERPQPIVFRRFAPGRSDRAGSPRSTELTEGAC